jgi:hypothetical protein
VFGVVAEVVEARDAGYIMRGDTDALEDLIKLDLVLELSVALALLLLHG